jgi:hypothetical protein
MEAASRLLRHSGIQATLVTDSAGRELLRLPSNDTAAAAMLILRERYGNPGELVQVDR